jgi:photosystem II stability/assembly factor-like uncharacterized protein
MKTKLSYLKKRFFMTLILVCLIWGATVYSPALQAAPMNAVLIVTDVEPNEGPNDLDIQITINGSGFVSGAEAILGDTALTDVTWVDETQITATVPWGMTAGIYPLTVINPDGETFQLPDAYTVLQGIGEWMTGGPYGGWINAITMGGDTDTVYATATNVGLFHSTDGGESWALIFIETGHMNLLEMDPRYPNWLYIAKRSGSLYHSKDGGDTWVDLPLPDPSMSPYSFRAFISPLDYKLYGAMASGNAEWGCGLFVFNQASQTWTRLTQTGILDENTDINMVAFDPVNPLIFYAGGAEGQVLKTEDGGNTWSLLPDTLLAYITRLLVSPYDGSVWISGHGESYSGGFYKLEGDTWVSQEKPGVDTVMDMVFDPDSPTLWISTHNNGLLKSVDGGENWSVLNDKRSEALALDPAHPAIIYSGSNEGIEKTTTEGASWELKNQGITGWIPEHLGMNPHNPAVIYGMVNSVGIFGSTDGGTHWERLTVSTGGPIVVDRLNALHVVNADYNIFHIAYDGMNFDNHVSISLPDGMEREDYAVIPNTMIARPDLWVMAAAYSDEHQNTWNFLGGGGIYLSNTGDDWTLVTPHLYCPITAVSFDPQDDNILYAITSEELASSTCESAFLKSTDYGLTWRSITEKPDIGWGRHMAVEPTSPYRIFLENLVSSDQGETWQWLPTPFSSFCRKGMLFIEGSPSILYAATCEGLYRTSNGWQTWQKAQGALGKLEIWSITGARVDEREILFAATVGGSVPSSTNSTKASRLTPATLINAGVYRFTGIQSSLNIFLPVIIK